VTGQRGLVGRPAPGAAPGVLRHCGGRHPGGPGRPADDVAAAIVYLAGAGLSPARCWMHRGAEPHRRGAGQL